MCIIVSVDCDAVFSGEAAQMVPGWLYTAVAASRNLRSEVVGGNPQKGRVRTSATPTR